MDKKKQYWCKIDELKPDYIRLLFNFTVPTATIWTNKKNGWRIYQGWRRTFDRVTKNFEVLKRAKCRKTVTVKRYALYPIRDDVNFRHGCKPMIDILKLKGFMVDDSDKWIKDIYEQKKHQGEGFTTVEITDWKLNEEGDSNG